MAFNILRQVVLTLAAGILLSALVFLVRTISIAFNSDLSKIPGPFLARFTNLPLKLAVLGGNRSVYIHALHQKYGSFVRIAPQEITIADIDGWRKIHKVGSDFNKGSWYQGQVPQQHSDETAGVFGILNNKKASVRRRMFQSAGTKKIVQEWEPMVVELATMTISNVQQELKTGKADIMKWWTFMTSDVLGDVAFGRPFDNVKLGKKNQLVCDIEETMPYIGVRIELPWLSYFFDLFTRLFYPSMRPPWKNLQNIGKQAVVDTRRAVREGNKTLFSKMVNEEDPKKVIPDHVIQQEATNLIVAGTDTTAMLLTYLTFEVLQNKVIHRRLVEECQALHEKPSWEELEALPYLNNVITEALRRHPSVPGSLKRVVPLGGEDFGEYIIPAGTQVDTQAMTFHLDPKVYQDPLKFDPDRWDNATPAMKEHLMAFGCPARICLGQNIARLEMLHALFLFFRACPDVQLAPSATTESMELVDFFSVKPKGGCLEIQPVRA